MSSQTICGRGNLLTCATSASTLACPLTHLPLTQAAAYLTCIRTVLLQVCYSQPQSQFQGIPVPISCRKLLHVLIHQCQETWPLLNFFSLFIHAGNTQSNFSSFMCLTTMMGFYFPSFQVPAAQWAPCLQKQALWRTSISFQGSVCAIA